MYKPFLYSFIFIFYVIQEDKPQNKNSCYNINGQDEVQIRDEDLEPGDVEIVTEQTENKNENENSVIVNTNSEPQISENTKPQQPQQPTQYPNLQTEFEEKWNTVDQISKSQVYTRTSKSPPNNRIITTVEDNQNQKAIKINKRLQELSDSLTFSEKSFTSGKYGFKNKLMNFYPESNNNNLGTSTSSKKNDLDDFLLKQQKKLFDFVNRKENHLTIEDDNSKNKITFNTSEGEENHLKLRNKFGSPNNKNDSSFLLKGFQSVVVKQNKFDLYSSVYDNNNSTTEEENYNTMIDRYINNINDKKKTKDLAIKDEISKHITRKMKDRSLTDDIDYMFNSVKRYKTKLQNYESSFTSMLRTGKDNNNRRRKPYKNNDSAMKRIHLI